MSIRSLRAAARRPKKRSRTVETTVSEIAQRPAPIRRSIFDLLDTLISSRERDENPPRDEGDAPDATDPQNPPRPPRQSGRARGNPESR